MVKQTLHVEIEVDWWFAMNRTMVKVLEREVQKRLEAMESIKGSLLKKVSIAVTTVKVS